MNEIGVFSDKHRKFLIKKAEKEVEEIISQLENLIAVNREKWDREEIENYSSALIEEVKKKIDALITYINLDTTRNLITGFYLQCLISAQSHSKSNLEKFPFYIVYLDHKLADFVASSNDHTLIMAYEWAHLYFYKNLGIKPEFIKNYTRLEKLKGKKFPEAILGSIRLANFFYNDDISYDTSKPYSHIDSYFCNYLELLDKYKNQITAQEYNNNIEYFANLGCIAAEQILSSNDNNRAKSRNEAKEEAHERCIQQAVGWLQNAADVAIHYYSHNDLYDIACKFLGFAANAASYGKTLLIQPALEWLKTADTAQSNEILAKIYLRGREIQPNAELALEYFGRAYEQFGGNQQYREAERLCVQVIEVLSNNKLNSQIPLWEERKELVIEAKAQSLFTPPG